jgi:hypothetical protein
VDMAGQTEHGLHALDEQADDSLPICLPSRTRSATMPSGG